MLGYSRTKVIKPVMDQFKGAQIKLKENFSHT